MKKIRRWLAAFLSTVIGISLFSVDSYASQPNYAGSTRAILAGSDVLEQQNGKWQTGSTKIYFGKVDNNGAAWRVLSSDNGTLLLDGDFLLKKDMFGSAANWSDSSIRSDLNGDTFYNNSDAFTSLERNRILSTKLEEDTYTLTVGESEDSSDIEFRDSASEDYIFMLSAKNAVELYGDNSARVKGTEASSWWLRSFDYTTGQYVGGTGIYGWVDTDGTVMPGMFGYSNIGVSPAFQMDTNGILLTSAAKDGKLSETVGASALKEVPAYTGNEWKLTLLDSSRSFSANSGGAVRRA